MFCGGLTACAPSTASRYEMVAILDKSEVAAILCRINYL